MEWNSLSNIGRGLAKEHSCEMILKSVHWFSTRSCLKLFSIALAAILFKGVERLEHFWYMVT